MNTPKLMLAGLTLALCAGTALADPPAEAPAADPATAAAPADPATPADPADTAAAPADKAQPAADKAQPTAKDPLSPDTPDTATADAKTKSKAAKKPH